MQPPRKHSWINLAELKDQLTKNIGPERSHLYFDSLKRFLSLKISKIEFNKHCLLTVGKDNISLHNQLIRLILKTAVGNKTCYHENGSIPVVHSKHPTESLGKKTEKEASTNPSRCLPLRIPHRRVRGSYKAESISSNSDTGGLVETTKLKEYMDQLAAAQGLQVPMDCASVLNNGLDAYLRRLIRSFSELNGSGSGSETMNNGSIKNQAHFRPLINGYRPAYLHQVQEHAPKRIISLLDLTVAMELNPQQLGVDWPILLEKVCIHGFKE
ncbi:hypothetical protein R6Q59_033949 [Mikania micrantha]|uniref:Transcriptional coactivator Hfi1/Transcriptional adapter 1 n=1 Tax=Mikania micrantha TaxID=192012 RepID=A0A5N6NJB8_9ASTR|nr:hypothetical protein E3N88_21254 [Mikania micrantha]